MNAAINGGSKKNVLFVAVAAVVIVAAAAAVIIYLNNNGDDSASGTMLRYEVSVDGEAGGIYERHGIGQNMDEYFFLTKTINKDSEEILYRLALKDVRDERGARMAQTVTIDTIDGRKSLEVWEYLSSNYGGEAQVKAYVDPSNGLEYRLEVKTSDETIVYTLIKYRLEWQELYLPTHHIGMSSEYASVGTGTPVKAEIRCVADCEDGRYGVRLEQGSNVLHFVSELPHGVPHNAVRTGDTATLTSLDGNVSVELLKYVHGSGEIIFYVDPDTNIIYRFSQTGPGGQTFDLVVKPREPRL